MEEKAKSVELLIEKATDYGKTTVELVKLKVLDTSSDVISSFIPISIALMLFTSFLLFFSLAMAFWLGEILGNNYYGFFIVAGFYCFIGIIFYLFMYKWIKRKVCNSIIKKVIK
ncbi:MAG: phage holin family protein [Bacteroidota bacterium]